MARNERTIGVGRDAVWAVLADGWLYANWVVGTSHMRAVGPDWPAAGSRLFHCSGAWPAVVRDRTEVDASEPGRLLTMTAEGRPFGAVKIEITLADAPGGCLVTLTETPVRGVGRALHNPISELLLRRRNTEALARLAALCERRHSPG